MFKGISLAAVAGAALVSAGAGSGHPQPGGGCPTVPWSLAQARACSASTPTMLVKHTRATCPALPWSLVQARACR